MRFIALLLALAQAPAAPTSPPAEPAAAPAQLTLAQAVQRALARNYDQVRVEIAARQAEQDQATARSAILPRLDATAQVAENVVRGGNVQFSQVDPTTGRTVNVLAPNQTYPTYAVGAQLKQLVFDGGKWWNNLAAASAQLAGTRANVEEQRLATAYAAEQRFFELIRQQRQLQVLIDAAARSRDQAGFVQRLYEGGKSTQADVYQARANRDADEIGRLTQQPRVEAALQDLLQIIGAEPGERLAPVEPPGLQDEPALPGAPNDLVQRALGGRPGLRAFQRFVEAQDDALSAARGDFFPQVSLFGQYQRTTRDAADLTAGPDKVGTLSAGVNLSWNLFQGFATQAAVRKQEQQVLLARNDLANGRRAVASDVERAAAQLLAARGSSQVAAQAVQTSQEGLRLSRARQQVGLGTQLEVRDAELKLTQSQLARINALLDGREAEAALRRAVGEPFSGSTR